MFEGEMQLRILKECQQHNKELMDILKRLYESAGEDYDPSHSSLGLRDDLLAAEKLLGVHARDSVI